MSGVPPGSFSLPCIELCKHARLEEARLWQVTLSRAIYHGDVTKVPPGCGTTGVVKVMEALSVAPCIVLAVKRMIMIP